VGLAKSEIGDARKKLTKKELKKTPLYVKK